MPIDPMLLQQMLRSPDGQGMSFPPVGQGGVGNGQTMIGPSFQGPEQYAPVGVQAPEWTPPPVGNAQQWTPPPTGDEGMAIDPRGRVPSDLGPALAQGAGMGVGAVGAPGPDFGGGQVTDGDEARRKLIEAIMRARGGFGG